MEVKKQKSGGNYSPNIAGDAYGCHIGDDVVNNSYTIIQNEEKRNLSIIDEIFSDVIKKIKKDSSAKVDTIHLKLTDKIKLNFSEKKDQEAVSTYFTLAYTKVKLIEQRLQDEDNELQKDIQAHVFQTYYELKSKNGNNIDILHALFNFFVPNNKNNDPIYTQLARAFILFFFDDCSIFDKTV